MGVLRVMDRRKGDVAVKWTVGDEKSQQKAKAAFDLAKGLGFTAFAFPTTEAGAEGKVVREFDPAAELIVSTPQIAGG